MKSVPRLSVCSFSSRSELDAAVEQIDCAQAQWLALSTCQRHELLILTREPFAPPQHAQRIFIDADAALRLFQIASGALSDVPGEQAVADQLRRALRAALRGETAGSTFAKLVRRALRTGDALRERVRRTAPILELADLLPPLIPEKSRIILLGAGALGRAIVRRGLSPAMWATRTPRSPQHGSIEHALRTLKPGDTVLSALANVNEPLIINVADVTLFNLGESLTIQHVKSCQADILTLNDVIDRSRQRLEPQAAAIARAAHRLPAQAEAALAETLCPSIKTLNRAISSFRKAIVDAELIRLAPALESCDDAAADSIRRSINHAAARSTHPLHEYINALGRQGRADDARLLVDHILGSRIGIQSSDPATSPLRTQGDPQ